MLKLLFFAAITSLGIIAIVMCIRYVHINQINHQTQVISENTLTHLSVIMDGNRRWARERGLESWHGHQHALAPFQAAIEFALEHHIPYLSVWAFALQNFKRSPEELHYLFEIVAPHIAQNEINRLIQAGVRVQFIGDRSRFPTNLLSLITSIEQQTAAGKNLNLIILFCYSGREEIIDTCKRLVQEVAQGALQPDDIDEKMFIKKLWTQGIPDPDLIIRTGKGNTRLSNYLQFQCAYSELYFLDCYWPDVTKEHLEQALDTFMKTDRRFGK